MLTYYSWAQKLILGKLGISSFMNITDLTSKELSLMCFWNGNGTSNFEFQGTCVWILVVWTLIEYGFGES